MSSQDPRVSAMFRRDSASALFAVVAVWLVYAFTFWTMRQFFSDAGVTGIMLALGACVLFLNTAAIVAMIRHYGEDRTAIYGTDIYYLDRLREVRRDRRAAR